MDGSELHGPACANSPPPPSPPPHSPPPRPPPPPSPPYRLLCPSHRHPCRRPRRRQQRRPARPSRAAPLPCVCVAHGRGVQQGSASDEAVVICLHSACGCSVTARDTDSPLLAGVAGPNPRVALAGPRARPSDLGVSAWPCVQHAARVHANLTMAKCPDVARDLARDLACDRQRGYVARAVTVRRPFV